MVVGGEGQGLAGVAVFVDPSGLGGCCTVPCASRCEFIDHTVRN